MNSRIETDRLLLTRPHREHAAAIFTRYSSDPEVTRYLSFRCHQSIAEAQAFVDGSEAEWARHGYGPLLAWSRETGELVGGSGIHRRDAGYVETGYLLARDAWGRGYATEIVGAMIALARDLGIPALIAHCHVDHRVSAHVLEKCGFAVAGIVSGHFPNLAAPDAAAMRYERKIERAKG